MKVFLIILAVIAMIATVVVLILGVRSMILGGNPQRSNKLMQSRIMFQFIALMLIMAVMLIAKHHS